MNIESNPGVAGRRRRGPRVIGWLLMGLLFAGLAAPVFLSLVGNTVVAQTATVPTATAQPAAGGDNNPRAEFWREVRQGTPGYSALTGQESGVLIHGDGENWRKFRGGLIITFGAWLMAFVLFTAAMLHFINGPQLINEGRSGWVILRWSVGERVIHWYVAILFILLTLTGLSLLYGRTLLMPWLGKDAFAAYAEFAKDVHNYLGPFFAVGLLLMLVMWFKDNLPIKADLQWAKTAGGMWGQEHPPADRMNAGEKLMYWQMGLLGLVVIASGFILDFPNYGQSRVVMQWSHVAHVLFAIGMIVTVMGHLYMALIGVEGAMEGMISGYVDTNWAEQHHNLWYEKMLLEGVEPQPAGSAGMAAGGKAAEADSV